MALLTQKGYYIKLDINGNYNIYTSKSYRNQEKYSTTKDYILNKYEELLKENNSNTVQWKAIENEYNYYKEDLALGKGARHVYNIMKKYCSDVGYSIPLIIESGTVYIEGCSTLHEVYEYVKSHGYFGPVIDV